jgi:hypothetical protein
LSVASAFETHARLIFDERRSALPSITQRDGWST